MEVIDVFYTAKPEDLEEGEISQFMSVVEVQDSPSNNEYGPQFKFWHCLVEKSKLGSIPTYITWDDMPAWMKRPNQEPFHHFFGGKSRLVNQNGGLKPLVVEE